MSALPRRRGGAPHLAVRRRGEPGRVPPPGVHSLSVREPVTVSRPDSIAVLIPCLNEAATFGGHSVARSTEPHR